MDRELSPEEIQDLLPAYALDAVDDDERAAIEGHLARDPEAREEAVELQSAASMLAHAGGPPPEGVWERLELLIADPPGRLQIVPSPELIAAPPRAPRARADRRWQWLAAAAAVVALVFAGLWIAERSGDTSARDTASLARAAAHTPGAQHVALTDTDGRTLATAVVLRDGTGYLTPKLPRLSTEQTYQLWGLSTTDTISLGVLGPHPHVVAFKAARGIVGLALTTEVAGGVPVSKNAPDAVGDVVSS